jgi:hypothetical protein
VSERVVATIIQPCILCEGDQERWDVWFDEEVSIERIEVVPLEHACPGMTRLLRERAASPHGRLR